MENVTINAKRRAQKKESYAYTSSRGRLSSQQNTVLWLMVLSILFVIVAAKSTESDRKIQQDEQTASLSTKSPNRAPGSVNDLEAFLRKSQSILKD